MFKIIGKAHYTVTYDGKTYPKIRYTLEMKSYPKSYNKVEGCITETVCIKYSESNNIPKIGDTVQVSYNKYGRPETLFII